MQKEDYLPAVPLIGLAPYWSSGILTVQRPSATDSIGNVEPVAPAVNMPEPSSLYALSGDLSRDGDTLNGASCNVVTSLEDVIFVASVAVPLLLQFVDNRVQNTGLASKSVLTGESGVRNKIISFDIEEMNTSVECHDTSRQRTLLLC